MVRCYGDQIGYIKYSKILYTKFSSDKTAFASSVDLDQTASSGLHCHFTKYFKKQLHKKQNLSQKVWNQVFKIFGHLS